MAVVPGVPNVKFLFTNPVLRKKSFLKIPFTLFGTPARPDKFCGYEEGGGGGNFLLLSNFIINFFCFFITKNKVGLPSLERISTILVPPFGPYASRYGTRWVPKISKHVFWVHTALGAPGGGIYPQVMSQLFVWDPLVPLLVSLGPYGYPHWCMGGIRLHTYRCHMGVIGVPEVKKSIFPLWSGIALGWSKWPKNTPKRPKTWIFGHHGTTSVHAGCTPVCTLWVPWPYFRPNSFVYRFWAS